MWKIVGASKDSVLYIYIYIYIYRLGSPNIDTGMGIGTDTGMRQRYKQFLKNYNKTWRVRPKYNRCMTRVRHPK